MKTKSQKEFEIKLKQLRIKNKFVNNLKLRVNKCSFDGYLGIENYPNWHTFISSAFDWNITPEGFKFWSNIAKK